MLNYKLLIAYRGTNYSGWQYQPDVLTVQGVLEETLSKIFNEKVRLIGASRTDAGVHALGQVANFKAEKNIPPFYVRQALARMLPPDIVVRECTIAEPSFHARHYAISKRYCYKIHNSPIPDPFLAGCALHIEKNLDASAMREGMRFLLGRHDFSSFQNADAPRRSPVKIVTYVDVKKIHDMIYIEIEANSFLYQMVRNIVGTLLEVGRGRLKPEDVKTILEACDRRVAGPTAPPHGLYLVRVNYPKPFLS